MKQSLRYYAFVLINKETGWKTLSSKTMGNFWPTLDELVAAIKRHKELIASKINPRFPSVTPRYKIYRETPDEFICEL